MDQHFSELLKQIYCAVEGLEEMFPGRPFTPDGHMVGSIGEAIGKEHYGIELYTPGTHEFDGEKNGKQIQIKATQRDSVALKHGHGTLLELKLEQNGDFEEIYNGNADRVWESRSHLKATNAGEKSISLSQLRTLQKEVDGSERIARMPESNAG